MTTPETTGGKAVLSIAYIAGMVDLISLPIWIGVLMQHYGYGPREAGLTVTVFLLGVVAASLFFAPRFNRLPRRHVAAAGFAVTALAFAMSALQPAASTSFSILALLHAVGGLGVGCALSFTHGTMGRSANPHRLFAVAGTALGVFAIAFVACMPPLIAFHGGRVLFGVVAALMTVASVCVLWAFPELDTSLGGLPHGADRGRIRKAAWLTIFAVLAMALNQTMVYAFLERIGLDRGFGRDSVNRVLIAVGLVNLFPAALAAVLQKRLAAQHVGVVAPLLQAALAVVITSSSSLPAFAVAATLYVSVLIFGHNFLFGLVARLDPSGRAAAATPVMMLGSAIGPALGGAITHAASYAAIGGACFVVALLASGCMWRVVRELAGEVNQVAIPEPAAAASTGPS